MTERKLSVCFYVARHALLLKAEVCWSPILDLARLPVGKPMDLLS